MISAYACGPGDEPEAAAGWNIATSAALTYDVWILTRPRFRQAIEADIACRPEVAPHVNVIYLDLPSHIVARKPRSGPALYTYYAAWQTLVARHGKELHRSLNFDVVHHVTWANDWLPCGAAAVAGPAFVWGPVGGASRMPIGRLARWLGARGTVTEIGRALLTYIPRSIWGDQAARRAALVVAQNQDVAWRFRSARRVLVEPNAALRDLPPVTDRAPRRTAPFRAVFPARLLALKGGRLAITAIANAPDWTLEIMGSGREERALRRLARRLDVEARVRFRGHRPRAEVLSALATADAMLFPSMHDQAGWVAAEASALGCPVVCLPLGGPPMLAGPHAFVASLEGDVVRNVVEQLELARQSRVPPSSRWDSDRFEHMVPEWYTTALRGGGPSRVSRTRSQ